jgi:hypothetical protein
MKHALQQRAVGSLGMKPTVRSGVSPDIKSWSSRLEVGYRVETVHHKTPLFLKLYRLYKDTDLVMYVHVKRLQGAGHVVRIFGNRIPKGIPEGSLERKRPVGNPRNR